MKKRKTAKKLAPLPEGFSLARTRLDGFFIREAGNSVTGVLRGVFKTKGRFGERRVYRIEVTDGETAVLTSDGERATAEQGQVIGLDETGYTKVLGELEPESVVFVRYEGKAGEEKGDHHIFTVGKYQQ